MDIFSKLFILSLAGIGSAFSVPATQLPTQVGFEQAEVAEVLADSGFAMPDAALQNNKAKGKARGLKDHPGKHKGWTQGKGKAKGRQAIKPGKRHAYGKSKGKGHAKGKARGKAKGLR